MNNVIRSTVAAAALAASAVQAGFIANIAQQRDAMPYYGMRGDAELCSTINWGFDGVSGSGSGSSDSYEGLPGACWSPSADCSNTGESFSCWEGMGGSGSAGSAGSWASGSGSMMMERPAVAVTAAVEIVRVEEAKVPVATETDHDMWHSDSWASDASGSGAGGCLCGNWLDFDFSVDQGSLAIEEAPMQSPDEIEFEARDTVLKVWDSKATISSESRINSNHIDYTFGDLSETDSKHNGAVGVSLAYTDDSATTAFTVIYDRVIEYVEKNEVDGFQPHEDITVSAHQFNANDFIFRQVYPSFKTQDDFGADLKFFEGTDGTLTTATAVTAGAKTQQYLMNGRLGCPHNTKSDFIIDYMPGNSASMYALQLNVFAKGGDGSYEGSYEALRDSVVRMSGNGGGMFNSPINRAGGWAYFSYVLKGYTNGNPEKEVDVITTEEPMGCGYGHACSSYYVSFIGQMGAEKVTWDPEFGVYGPGIDYGSSASAVAASIVSVATVVAAALLF